jgi:4-amino-4-deoxy-L-arabinose transferase-like glycosyltransferase
VHWPHNAADWQRWLQLQLWFTWPAWPLALWTLWRWRRQLGSAHVALPLWGLAMGLWASLVLDDKDRALLPVLSSVAVLAAFALPTLRRSASALIDWFALLFFSACALVIWTVWLAMQTGMPAKPAANVAKLAPGFAAEFGWLAFLLALAATVAWVALVAWRSGAHRPALWKSLVLPAAGTTLCWLLLMTLWLPLLDFARSYAAMSNQLARLLPPQSCVLALDLSPSQVAALRYHAKLQVQELGHGGAECQHLVTSSRTRMERQLNLTQWAYKARVYRLGERRESLVLYQRLVP